MSTSRDETRLRILEAARRLLLERGYFGVGLEDVGAAAGISRQAIYQHHFRSKAELLLALVAYVDEVERVQELIAPAFAAPTGVEALTAMVAAIATVNERIHDIAGVLASARLADPAAEAAWQDRMKRRHAGAESVIRRLEAEGRLATGWSAPDAADYLFTALSLATYQTLVLERQWPKARYVKRLRQTLHATLVEPARAGRSRTGNKR